MKRYPYRLKEVNVKFEFDSIGPRGVIRKVVEYETTTVDHQEVINLGLGDWDEQRHYANDDVKSKNRDVYTVLATVAATCLAMLDLHPGIRLYAKGGTASRNRLYRIGIAKNWNEIEKKLEIEGLWSGKWEPFNPSMDYEAFRARRKQL